MVHKTIYLPVDKAKRLGIEKYPSAGPYSSISGMKWRFWGKDAYCIKSGIYVYKVDKEFYELALSRI